MWAWKKRHLLSRRFRHGLRRDFGQGEARGVSQHFRPIPVYIGAVITMACLPASRQLLTTSGESLKAPHRRDDHEVPIEWIFRPAAIDCLLSATLNPSRILRVTAKITPLSRVVDGCEILHDGY